MTVIDIERYRTLRARLRACLSQSGKWREAPALLDELDRVRSGAPGPQDETPVVTRAASPRLPEAVWVARFAATLRRLGQPGDPERGVVAARALWQWFGHLDPERLAHGGWDELPRCYA